MPNYEPIPVLQLDPSITRRAILLALSNREWIAEGESEGTIQARLDVDEYSVLLDITYDDTAVRTEYRGSRNLDCQPRGASCSRIHRSYDEWVDDLREEIRLLLASPPTAGPTPILFSKVRVGTEAPGSDAEQIAYVSAEDGIGCGPLWGRGSFDRALYKVKQKAAGLGGDYVRILRSVSGCTHLIEGVAYRLGPSSAGSRRDRFAAQVPAGTCFSVSPDRVLTAHHVVHDSRSGRVEFEDGREYRAEVEEVDVERDLAILRIDGRRDRYLPLAKARDVSLGEPVFTLGYPGLLGDAVKYTEGSVSALRGPNGEKSLLQISIPVQPGNSGGPVVDDEGRVVGIVIASVNDAAFFRGTGALPQNVNFAVKSRYAKSLFDEPETHGEVRGRNEAIEAASSSVCTLSVPSN